MHIPFARQQFKLALGEIGIEQHQRQAVKAQIPTGIPGIFPLVRHRNHVEVVQVFPLGVAPIFAAFGRWRHPRIALEPLLHIVVVKLLRPEHPGEGLALDGAHVGAERFALDCGVELVRLIAAMLVNLFETCGKDARLAHASGADAALSSRPRRQAQVIDRRRFGAAAFRVDRAAFAVDQIAVEGIFGVGLALGVPKMRSLLVSFSVKTSSGGVGIVSVEIIAAHRRDDGREWSDCRRSDRRGAARACREHLSSGPCG